jgi:hypothetical protein
MAAPDVQHLADASENDAAQRYVRGQLMASVVEEAMRRADAMSRLDASLRLAGRRRPS